MSLESAPDDARWIWRLPSQERNTGSMDLLATLDTGNNSWQMTAATLVGPMSIPGLVVLYGGVMQKRWSVNSMMMAFVAFAVVLVLWVKMGFGEPVHTISNSGFFGNFIGKPGAILGSNELLKQAHIPELAEEEFLFP